MKKVIISMIISGMVFGTIGVLGANYLYNAKEVSYKSTTVQAAVEDLYSSAGSISENMSKLVIYKDYTTTTGKSSVYGAFTFNIAQEGYTPISATFYGYNGYAYHIGISVFVNDKIIGYGNLIEQPLSVRVAYVKNND